MTAPLPESGWHNPHHPAAPSPARCSGRSNRPECGGFRLIKMASGLANPRAAGIQGRQPQPTSGTGMGMDAQTTRAAPVKQRTRQRSKLAWISQTPQLRTAPLRRCGTPLSPQGHGVVAGSNHRAASGPPHCAVLAEPGAARVQATDWDGLLRVLLQLPARLPRGHQMRFQAVGAPPIFNGRHCQQWKRCSSKPLAVSKRRAVEGGAAGAQVSNISEPSLFWIRRSALPPETFAVRRTWSCCHALNGRTIRRARPRGRRCRAAEQSQSHEDGPSPR